jgi:pimeloyl-ACP methyl ester carboxylesterase
MTGLSRRRSRVRVPSLPLEDPANRHIGPLSDPGAHGGDPADAFHVVAPSIPGFAFSGPTRETGWGLQRISEAFAALMSRLGYERYGAQGGGFGALLSPELGRSHPDRVVGVHVNGFLVMPPRDPAQLAELTERERQRLETFKRFWRNGRAYAAIQATRPQTLAYALTDSPVGQLAWIVEKFKEWTASSKRPGDAVDRDQLLTNVTVYWLTGTAGSSARLYKETANDLRRANERSTVPTGVAVFRGIPFRPSGGSPSVVTTSCTGPSSTGAATSRRWRCPTCSSAICAGSSAASDLRVL